MPPKKVATPTVAVKKKEDKGVTCDEFGPLRVELCHIGTFLLMLDSPEEPILEQSINAICRFIENPEYSKSFLANPGFITRLLDLLTHENKAIRQKACRALGNLSENSYVAVVMKKCEGLIQALILLLSPAEESAQKEYATLCLSELVKYELVKADVLALGGLEALLLCLTPPSPDVQHNAIKAIVGLLESYAVQKAVRELSGFPPIIALLNSEYAILQHQALQALQCASRDVENRAALRELGLLTHLIDLIGHHKHCDLHLPTMILLYQFFDDIDSVKLLTSEDQTQLARLIALVTDEPRVLPIEPPDPSAEDTRDADPKAKGKGKDAVKGKEAVKGKKGAKAAKEPVEDEKVEAPVLVVVPMCADVKVYLALAIARAATNPESRQVLHKHQVERPLVLLLRCPCAMVRIAAAQAVATMGQSLLSRALSGQCGAVEPLIAMAQTDHGRMKAAASATLAVLTDTNDFNCQEVGRCECGMETIIALLGACDESVLLNAMTILRSMAAAEDKLKTRIIDSDLIPALHAPLSSPCVSVQCNATHMVCVFVRQAGQRRQLMQNDGVSPILKMLESDTPQVRQTATQTLVALIQDTTMAEEITRLGGLETLRRVHSSEELKTSFTNKALYKLLDNNLSAKYAITGVLCVSDVTADPFYDVGRLECDAPFHQLKEYGKEPICQPRPVILATFTPRWFGDDADLACLPRVEDRRLCAYVCEMRDKLRCLESQRERVVALAEFVAEKMGGPVVDLVNFSWELPMSELKFNLNLNVVPIGLMTMGTFQHRALLFKVLADHVGVECSLVRGPKFKRAWNEIFVCGDKDEMANPYIVDLMHCPGQLMHPESAEAINYMAR